MRRWIEGWHVGQLVLAWFALIVAWCLAGAGAIVSLDAHANAKGVREARADLARDSAVRATPSYSGWITLADKRDTALTELEEGYLRSLGLIPENERALKQAIARESAFDPLIFLVPLSAVLVALPIVGYFMTWVWFGARARGAPP